MMKTGKYEMPKGSDASEAAGAELNRVFQRIPQVNKELADLRRQLKRAKLGGGEATPRARGRRREAEAATVAPVAPEAPPSPESAKLEAASKFKVNQEVKVRRSDGSIEGKWMVTEIGADGMVGVVKNVQEAPGRIKTYSKYVPADELLEKNRRGYPQMRHWKCRKICRLWMNRPQKNRRRKNRPGFRPLLRLRQPRRKNLRKR
jgi:hypothetical protein